MCHATGLFEVVGALLLQLFFDDITPFRMEWMLALVAGVMVALTFIELLPHTLEMVRGKSDASLERRESAYKPHAALLPIGFLSEPFVLWHFTFPSRFLRLSPKRWLCHAPLACSSCLAARL